MTLPMGPSAFALSGEKLSYIESRLVGPGRFVRWSILAFITLIFPSLFFVSVESSVTLTILGVLGGFMMRNVDTVFGRLFGNSGISARSSQSVDISTAVPFIFPFVFMVFLGWIFDLYVLILITVQMVIYEYLLISIPLLVQLATFIARSIVLVRLGPVARLIMDPEYRPSSMGISSSSATSELLSTRNPPPAAASAFVPFQGSGNTLQSNASE